MRRRQVDRAQPAVVVVVVVVVVVAAASCSMYVAPGRQ